MNPRWAGLTAPFRWLIDAFDVGRHQPAAVVGAIVATTLIGFLPSLPPQVMAMAGSPPGFAVQAIFQLLAFAMGIAITPVLTAGVYGIIDGAERGTPVASRQIFDGFTDGRWGRIVATSLLTFALMIAIVTAMLIVMAVVVGPEALQAFQQWLEQVMALQQKMAESGGTMTAGTTPPPPPDGLGSAIAVMFAFLPLWSLVAVGASWALVSVALRGVSPVAAVVAGLRAAFLNALPLLLFAFAVMLPVLLMMMLFGLVMAAVVALASLIAPALGVLAALLMTIALTLVAAAVGYAFVLNGWRATCDDGERPDAAPSAIAGFEA